MLCVCFPILVPKKRQCGATTDRIRGSTSSNWCCVHRLSVLYEVWFQNGVGEGHHRPTRKIEWLMVADWLHFHAKLPLGFAEQE